MIVFRPPARKTVVMSDSQPMPAAPSDPPAPYPDYTQRYNILAVLAFVFVWLTVVGGIVLGYIALAQIKRTNEQGRGLALAAVVLGWIGLAAGIVLLIIFALAGWFTVNRY